MQRIVQRSASLIRVRSDVSRCLRGGYALLAASGNRIAYPSMIQCPACQRQILDDSHVCSYCGAAVESVAGDPPAATPPQAGPAPAPQMTPGLSSHPADRERFTPGTMLTGRYRILSLLGKGGMGEVYRAKDARLDRDVAVKVLPEHMAKNPEALTRFQREAKAVAALSHPNILGVHDVGTEGDLSFVVMELLEGETLRERVRGSALPWRKAVEIGTAIADGLAAAHAKGIIHRDLKPENIFLTKDGVVKILDFGLAHVETASGSQSAGQADTPTMTLDTRPGTILGTINYMSPEQVRGQRTDARSDIFSFGCVLYEMVTGRRAFTGDSPPETMTAILKHHPSDMTESGVTTVPELDRVIGRCLEKKSEQRIHSARDLGFALRDILSDTGAAKPLPAGDGKAALRSTWAGKAVWIAVGAVVVMLAGLAYVLQWGGAGVQPREAIDSLAVMPFVIAGGDPRAEYLGEEIPATIIDSMSQLPGLRVVPRSTVFRLAKDRTDHRQIAKELGVRAILSGEVSQRGERLSVRVALVDVRSDRQLWGERYDRTEDDILAIEKDIAKHISDTLRMRLTGTQRTGLVRSYTDNTQAYRAYKEARFWWNKRTQDGFDRAIALYDEAIRIDPSYALAYAGKADCYCLAGWYFRPAREVAPKVMEAVDAALAVDPQLPEAYPPRAWVRAFIDWDWAGAERDFRRAIKLNPDYATAHSFYSTFLAAQGRLDEAEDEIRRARELDPGSLIINKNLGVPYSFRRQHDRAIEQHRNTLAMDPTFIPARLALAAALKANHQYDEAIAEIQRVYEEVGRYPRAAGWLAAIHAAAGHHEQARQELRTLTALSRQQYIPAVAFAFIHAELGDYDAAFARMDEAFEARDSSLAFLAVSPWFDALRPDPRFDDLLRRVGLEDVPRPATDVGAISPMPGKITLAVLPFEQVSGDPDARFLADEIPASIIDTLSTLSDLRVIARSTAFRHRDREEDPAAVGRLLGANVVLTGQITARGSDLRIRAELVDVATKGQRWGARYDRSLDNTAAAEVEITERIVQALRVHVTGEEQTRLQRRRPADDAAHSAYLEGRFWWNKRTESGLLRSIELFDKAIGIDPRYALAYAGKADSYCSLGWAYRRPGDMFPQARVAAERALALDPELAEAYPSLGWVRLAYDWDWAGAEKAFQKAIDLDPRYPTAHQWYAICLLATGRVEAALREARLAQQLDPGSLILGMSVGAILYNQREYAAAAQQLNRTLEMAPTFPPARQMLGLVYLRLQRYDDAIDVFRRLHGYGGRVPANAGQLGLAYALSGRRAEALEELRILEALAKERYIPSTAFALIHAGLGEMDQAFRWMDQAVKDRDHFPIVLRVSPTFDELRGDPRFNDLLRRIGLEGVPQPPAGMGAISPMTDKITLAVLPFEPASAGPDTEYLKGEIPASIIHTLSTLSGLQVIPRSTAFRFQVGDRDTAAIGRELGATAVLTGQINTRGDTLVIRAELVDVATNSQLWDERYNRKLADIMAIEEDIAKEISEALRLHLTGEERAQLTKRYTENAEAYQHYLKGRSWWNKFTADGYRKALFYFEQAIEEDPIYAAAYAELANTYILMGGWYGDMPPREAFPKAKEAAVKALEIDPGLAEAHGSLGFLRLVYEWDWQGAEQAFVRAIGLNPDSATAHGQYTILLHAMGRFDEAQERRKRALSLDPLSPIIHSALGWGHAQAGEHERAVESFTETLRLHPGFPPAYAGLGFTYLSEGKYEDAIAAFRRARLESRNASFLGWLGLAYARAGKRTEAVATLDELEQASTTGHGRVPAALVHAALGNVERAFEFLEIAYDERESELVWLNTLLPFDSLRGDPRFDDLLQRIGLPPSAPNESSSPSERPE